MKSIFAFLSMRACPSTLSRFFFDTRNHIINLVVFFVFRGPERGGVGVVDELRPITGRCKLSPTTSDRCWPQPCQPEPFFRGHPTPRGRVSSPAAGWGPANSFFLSPRTPLPRRSSAIDLNLTRECYTGSRGQSPAFFCQQPLLTPEVAPPPPDDG